MGKLRRRSRAKRSRTAMALGLVGALIMSMGVVLLSALPASADGTVPWEGNGVEKICDGTLHWIYTGQSDEAPVLSVDGNTYVGERQSENAGDGAAWHFYTPSDGVSAESEASVSFTGESGTNPMLTISSCESTTVIDACPAENMPGNQPAGTLCSKGPDTEPAFEEEAKCESGYRSRTGVESTTYEFDFQTNQWVVDDVSIVWNDTDNDGDWSGWQTLTPAIIERFGLSCGGGQTPTKNPESFTQVDTQMSCAQGVTTRSRSVTTTFVWNAAREAFDSNVSNGPWSSWVFDRALSNAEFEQLGCRPDQPEPVELLGAETRMDCAGVEERSSTQVTTFEWNEDTREYEQVVGAVEWSDWVKVRNLSKKELRAEGCVLGEETLVPKPRPEQKPTVKGVERVAPPAAVPTAVAAGVGGEAGSSTAQLLAQMLLGGGLLLLLAGGWVGFGRREGGAHEA